MGADIPAGWYPNPWNDAEELYWSGAEWTGISRAVRRAPQPEDAAAVASDVEDSTVLRPVGPAAAATTYAPAYAAPFTEPQASAEPTPGAPVSATHGGEAPIAFGAEPALFPSDVPLPDATGAEGANAATIRWALNEAAPAAPAKNPRARFGLIGMILGIVAAVFAIVPGLSLAAWVPAFVGIGLSIVGYLGGKPRGFALAGIITGGAALAVGTAVSIWFLTQLAPLLR